MSYTKFVTDNGDVDYVAKDALFVSAEFFLKVIDRTISMPETNYIVILDARLKGNEAYFNMHDDPSFIPPSLCIMPSPHFCAGLGA